MNDHEFLTVIEVAELLRLSRNTVYDLVKQKVLPSISFGRRILIPRDALDRFIARQLIMRQQTDGTDEEAAA